MTAHSGSSDDPLRNEGTLENCKDTAPDKPRRSSRQPLLKWGKLHLRSFNDSGEEDWWFASTAIPLIAATVGPLANVLSISALVVPWRMNRLPGGAAACDSYNGDLASLLPELQGISYHDPNWCYILNIISLVAGFVGNLFLLANFTNRIRYIVALPVTILLWYLATGILTGITISMDVHVPPVGPCQTYTQGYWYAVIAAVLYFACSMMLMVNMLGYFLGHYPQHFNLTESQRTLILQTMMFFLWLAGGAAVFSKIEQEYGGQNWLFTDGLYFCDVTILTVGFGDLTPADDTGRGIVFPYSVGGIIMLGLMVSSLTTFVGDMGKEKVIQKHINNRRQRTLNRSTTLQHEYEGKDAPQLKQQPTISRPIDGRRISIPLNEIPQTPTTDSDEKVHMGPVKRVIHHANSIRIAATPKRRRKNRLHLLQKEKDRFEAMRRIQRSASKFKGYTALIASTTAFCILWLAGAAVFRVTEAETLGISYFEALYFCYVSLLTIGYGDLAPRSNAGRPFFVVWSLLAVPTMTILISHLGSTLIASFNKATSALADFTVLPKYGVWRAALARSPRLLRALQDRADRRERERRLGAGFPAGPSAEEPEPPATLEQLATEDDGETSVTREARLARRLAEAVRRVSADLRSGEDRTYSYEEWVEITQLIRFTTRRRLRRCRGFDGPADETDDEDDEGLIEWDWIGEDSPMMAGKSEPEFVMERLCESLARYMAALETMGPAGSDSISGKDDRGQSSAVAG